MEPMLSATHALLGAIGLCLGGALVAACCSRNKTLAGGVTFAITAAAGALALYAAALVLQHGAERPLTLVALPALGSAWRLSLDGLSVVFVGLIAVIAVPAALYAIRYMTHYTDYGVARFYPNFLLFIAGMLGMVTTTDLMAVFCGFWQLMTLPSYLLIRYEYRKRENVRAANRYLLMMEIACALVMLAAGVLAGPGPVAIAGQPVQRFDLDALRAQLAGVPGGLGSGLVTLGLILFLAGFGIKAGMWPFGQLWLPDAHPAAPSPVSALLSGVMIKTGVYGLMRTFLWLIPAGAQAAYPARNWGLTLAVFGTVTLFVGTLQALQQEQSKRLLAFSSIGQVGYILLGLGACVALLPAGATNPEVLALAAMAFYGALFHTINHGLFKSLLFLNAGTMLYATGTQDLNRLGGLMRHLPVTAVTALIASFAIAGVPLFNGFASKWCLYVATILGGRAVAPLAVCGLFGIVTSALTLAALMKFFGISFLSRTSPLVAERAAGRARLGGGWTMRGPEVALAALCVLLGVVPALAYRGIQQALAASGEGLGATLAQSPPLRADLMTGLATVNGTALLAPLLVAVVFGALLFLAWGFSRQGGAARRTAELWLCGYAREHEMHRYTAHNFYGEFKRYFRWVGGVPRKSTAPPAENKGTDQRGDG